VQGDVGDVAQARGCVAAVIAEFGRVDSLVIAAGLTDRGTLLDTTPELFDAHIAVNLKGPFFLMQAVVAHLVAREAPGSIVSIGSTSAHAGDDWRAKAGASLPMGKLGQVGEIADFVVFLLSDRSGVVTGSVIDWDQNVLGGMD
jgi:NAD(P)-dependent dehydrogenase (short-subunit alcohol dehydrogenase family)